MTESIDPKLVGYRIREIRKRLGLSMTAFAGKIDKKAKSGTVSNWETGKNLPNNERLKKIAEIGDMSVTYLTTGKKTFNDLSDKEKEKESKKLKNDLNSLIGNQNQTFLSDISNIDIGSFNYNSLRSISYHINLVNNFKNNDEVTNYLATFPEYLAIYAFEKQSADLRKKIKADLLNDCNNLLDILDRYNDENNF